jgi:hypothetical protein
VLPSFGDVGATRRRFRSVDIEALA